MLKHRIAGHRAAGPPGSDAQLNGATAAGDYATAGYYKGRDGAVHLKGTIRSTVSAG